MPAERTMIEADKAEQVHAARSAFQDAVGDQFIEIVERATGGKVRAFMSVVHIDPEVAGELFLMEPSDGANGTGETPGASPADDGQP